MEVEENVPSDDIVTKNDVQSNIGYSMPYPQVVNYDSTNSTDGKTEDLAPPSSKQLQLKLGASLLNTRKKSAVDVTKPDLSLSFPTAMPPPQVTPVTATPSKPEPSQLVKTKSSKLCLPSLIGRKKPQPEQKVG